MTYLVTGATGNVGRHVVAELVRGGHRVRALTRDPAKAAAPPGAEVVAGDLGRPETLGAALDGVAGLHLITSDERGPLRTGPEIVELAAEAGVRRVTLLWSGERGPVEEAVEEGDLEWTRLEPTEFMSNMLAWAESVRGEGVVREPFADQPSTVIHEGDIGRVAAAVLAEGGHGGRTYPLSGPEVLTPPMKVRILGEAIGRDLRFVGLDLDQARARLRDAGHPEDLIDFVVGWHADPPEMSYTVSPAVEEITGRPARTLAEWAAEHADVFRV